MTAPRSPSTIFVIDDDASVLRAVERLLRSAGHEVVAYHSPAEFLQEQNPATPGCLILDVAMPSMTGQTLAALLAAAGNHLPVIFLTGNGDIPMSVAAMKSGAIDFLSKPCSDADLLDAINRALTEDRRLRSQRMETHSLADLFATLTPREYEVMLGVLAGQLNKTIAKELGPAEKTIKVHRGRMMAKLNVASVADLVRLCIKAGIQPK